MNFARCNGIEICYRELGPQDGEPMVLINGLGSQMIRWGGGFLELLTDEGFHLVTFDNRDVGLSTKLSEARDNPPYTVDDMARDVVGLLDHLKIDRAHLVGQSMGGMIAQMLAVRSPGRVLSLASVMSSTGGAEAVAPDDPDAIGIFIEPAASGRDDVIEQDVRQRRVLAGRGFPFNEERMRALAAECFDRCYDPAGRARQAMAVLSSPGRAESLAAVDVPTVVIHGTDDKLVPPANAEITAKAIPGAEIVLIDGMGHELPEGAWPDVAAAITENARRAQT
jgi:pimeloyl-ACP methyl ester carboxylesterase